MDKNVREVTADDQVCCTILPDCTVLNELPAWIDFNYIKLIKDNCIFMTMTTTPTPRQDTRPHVHPLLLLFAFVAPKAIVLRIYYQTSRIQPKPKLAILRIVREISLEMHNQEKETTKQVAYAT